MKLSSVITGDIISSRTLSKTAWLDGLKKILSTYGKTPHTWEIYRGDEFQLEIIKPEDSFYAALRIKTFLKSIKADARMAIGIGSKTHAADKVSESNGSAFVNSGEIFGTLKSQKVTLAVKTGETAIDPDLNLMLRLALNIMDNWPAQSAAYVAVALDNESMSQEEIGHLLGINQAAVSRRRKRSQLDLILEVDSYYRKQISQLK